MHKQKTIKAKPRHCKTVAKNKYNQKSKYFEFDASDKKWQGIYSFIIK